MELGTRSATRHSMRKDALFLLGVLGLQALLHGGPAARASESNADSVQSTQRTQSQAFVRMMTLKEALAHAQQHQPSLLAARLRIVAAQKAARSIRAEWLPQLGVTAQGFYGTMNNSTAMFLGVRTVDLPRIGGSRSDGGFGDSYPSSVVALGLRQNVWDLSLIHISEPTRPY